MYIGRVIGSVVCTREDERLKGIKLLLVQLQLPDGGKKGGPQVALDAVGVSGAGDWVYLTKGKEAALPFPEKTVPTELSVVGVIDKINLSKG